MPNFDGTGPKGGGLGSGRGNGPCRGAIQGGGLGRRLGYCFRNGDSPSDLPALEQAEKILEQELAMIKKHKQELENTQK